MKIVVGIVLILFNISCESNLHLQKEPIINATTLPVSMKGYELYSWPDAHHWNYTLITGTNRMKIADEIISADNIENDGWIKITVQDTRELINLLQRLPSKQSVIWNNSPVGLTGFSLPPFTIVQQIRVHGKALDLDLYIN